MARKALYPPSIKPGIPKLGNKPNGWNEVTFGDVLQPVVRTAKLSNEREYQLVTAKRSRGGIVPRERLRGHEIKTKVQFFVRGGDFLISKRQIIHGACGVVPETLDGALVSGEYLALLPKPGLLLDYIRWFCHSTYFQQTCFHASVGVDVEKMVFDEDEWLQHHFFLPPLPEQRAIAAILATWDRAIEQTTRLIEANRRLKQGLMQQLLTGMIRIPGHAGSWQSMSFADLASPVKDRYSPASGATFVRCVELEHIAQGDGCLLGDCDGSQQGSLKVPFKPGDVLYGKLRPYLRKFVLADFEGVCSSEIWVLRPNRAVCDSRYLFQVVQSDDFNAVVNATCGSKMPRAEWSLVATSTFSVPPFDEQVSIADVLSTSDREISALKQLVQLWTAQKQALMQKLLTGQMRVKGVA